jgi:predicted acetyltransferase
MNIDVVQAPADLKPVVLNLSQYYIYDFSEYLGFAVTDAGQFRADCFDKYWTESDRWAFLLRVDGEWAGFAFVGPDGSQAQSKYDFGEFFVMRKFRRRGVGQAFAFDLFNRFTGPWEVRVLVENTSAQAFWRKVVHRYTDGHYTELPEPVQCGQWRDIVLTFNNKQ